MELQKLHDPNNSPMRVVGLMSGSGSNLRKILDFERFSNSISGGSPYKVVVIFSDTFDSNAVQIGKDFDLPVVVRDIRSFYNGRGKPLKEMHVRKEFDAETVKALAPYEATVAAYAGYMSIATAPLINAFLGVNVHPADLTATEGEKRKYTGDDAVRDAILAGERQLRSSTHIIEEKVDYGKILMVSPPLDVDLGDNFNPKDSELVTKVADEHQDRLKKAGDWVIFPKSLFYIAEGNYAKDAKGNLYFNGEPIPQGVDISNIEFPQAL